MFGCEFLCANIKREDCELSTHICCKECVKNQSVQEIIYRGYSDFCLPRAYKANSILCVSITFQTITIFMLTITIQYLCL